MFETRGIIFLIITGTILVSPSFGFPAQRRTLTLVDRLIRANPLRSLANYIGQKFSMEVYYPPPPQFGETPSSSQAHYVKVPVPSWKPMPMYYTYTPTVAMIAPMVPQQYQQQNSQMAHHSISYNIPNTMIRQEAATYKPVFVQVQPPSVQHNSAYYMSAAAALAPSNQLYNNGMPILPAVVKTNVDQGDNNLAENEVKVIVLRPSDLETMKGFQEESKFMNDYTMKIIDLEENDPDEYDSVPSSSNVSIQDEKNVRPSDSGGSGNDTSCSLPLCHSFLKKLIPELLSSHSTTPERDVRDVIVTNTTIINISDNSDEEKSSEEEPTVFKAVESSVDELAQVSKKNQHPATASHLLVRRRPKKVLSAKINSTTLRKYEPRNRQEVHTPSYDVNVSKVHQNVHKLTHDHMVKSVMTEATKDDFHVDVTTSSSATSTEHPLVRATMERFEIEDAYPYRYGAMATRMQRVLPVLNAHHNDKNTRSRFTTTASGHYTGGVIFNKDRVHG